MAGQYEDKGLMPHMSKMEVNGTEFSVDEVIRYPFSVHIESYIDKTTGERVPFTSGGAPYCSSTWIPIFSNDMVLFASNGGDAGGIAYYDEGFTFISGEDGPASWAGNVEYRLHPPADARYMRFTQMIGHWSTAYVIGTATQAFDDYTGGTFPGNIAWDWDGAWSTETGVIVPNVVGAKYSDMLLLRSSEKMLHDYWAVDPAGYFYKTLYDIGGNYIGTQTSRNGGYKDAAGNVLSNPPDYYSYTLTVSVPYSQNCERTCYLDNGTVKEINARVNSIAALESWLRKAAHYANPTLIYNITIAEGEYDVWEGIDKNNIKPWAEYHAGDHIYMRGLELPGYTNIYGEGNCILKLLLPENQRQNYELVVSCLNTNGSNGQSVHNIKFIAKNCRYCVHDDAGELANNGTVLWDNCYFTYLGMTDTYIKETAYCYGGGFFEGRHAIFRNCVFDGGTDAGSWAGIFVHNHATARKPFYVDVENCVFKHAGHGIYMNMFYNYNENYTLTVNNSKFDSTSDILLGGAGGGKLFGGGNSEVTVSDTASTPTENYLIT